MSLEDRTLALAGALQFTYWAIRLARHGEHPEERVIAALDSLVNTDPVSVEDVFGGRSGLVTGLKLLTAQLGGGADGLEIAEVGAASRITGQLMRHAGTVMELPNTLDLIRKGLEPIKQARSGGGFDPAWVDSLAGLYVEHISPIRPRIVVSGNPTYLRNEQLAAKIRTLLFASLRAGILWRQIGGRFWQLLVNGRAVLAESKRLQSSLPPPRPPL